MKKAKKQNGVWISVRTLALGMCANDPEIMFRINQAQKSLNATPFPIDAVKGLGFIEHPIPVKTHLVKRGNGK